MKKSKDTPEKIELSEADVESLCRRLEENTLTDGDRTLIVKVMKATVWMTRQLELGRLGMGRLKKLLFGEKSEKKDKIFPPKPKSDTPEGQKERHRA